VVQAGEDSIPPHVGYGGGTPSPRNDRLASVRITVESPVVATMMIVGSTLGRMWVAVIRACPAPAARAPSM